MLLHSTFYSKKMLHRLLINFTPPFFHKIFFISWPRAKNTIFMALGVVLRIREKPKPVTLHISYKMMLVDIILWAKKYFCSINPVLLSSVGESKNHESLVLNFPLQKGRFKSLCHLFNIVSATFSKNCHISLL